MCGRVCYSTLDGATRGIWYSGCWNLWFVSRLWFGAKTVEIKTFGAFSLLFLRSCDLCNCFVVFSRRVLQNRLTANCIPFRHK